MPAPDRSDDNTIPDQEFLWRLVNPERVKWDTNRGEYRPISGVFRDPAGELSVNLASLTTIANTLKGALGPNYSIVQFQVALIRSFNCIVIRDPEINNSSHALVCPKISKGEAKIISNECAWVFLNGIFVPVSGT